MGVRLALALVLAPVLAGVVSPSLAQQRGAGTQGPPPTPVIAAEVTQEA